MRRVEGKLVYDRLEEIVRPDRTALLVVDMQNDFCSPQGIAAKGGSKIEPVVGIVPGIKRLLESARRARVRTIFMRHTHEADLSNLSPARLSFYAMLYGGSITPYHCIRGSWGHEVVADLSPQQGDTVINKDRSSAFIATNLDLILRSNKIESVVITGMATHACVESTARDAGFFDYYAVVLTDCVGDYSRELHEASLLTLSHRCVLSTSDKLLPIWRIADTVQGASLPAA